MRCDQSGDPPPVMPPEYREPLLFYHAECAPLRYTARCATLLVSASTPLVLLTASARFLLCLLPFLASLNSVTL
jgi:hypothetical protein